MWPPRTPFLCGLLFIALLCRRAAAIRCYQCSTDQEEDGKDNCGAYNTFWPSEHVLVDCLGPESVTPGYICMKTTQLSPRGYIWDGRWRTVIRRCAYVSERGILTGCDWGYSEHGIYWQQCYCNEDGCNGASELSSRSLLLLTLSAIISIVAAKRCIVY